MTEIKISYATCLWCKLVMIATDVLVQRVDALLYVCAHSRLPFLKQVSDAIRKSLGCHFFSYSTIHMSVEVRPESAIPAHVPMLISWWNELTIN
jgi:hypothetical protein